MDKLIGFMMYILWVASIIAILVATFTSFEYEDINLIATVLFIFAVVNSFFLVARNWGQQKDKMPY